MISREETGVFEFSARRSHSPQEPGAHIFSAKLLETMYALNLTTRGVKGQKNGERERELRERE